MTKLSTQQAAKILGIGKATLSRHIAAGKVPAPPETMAGGMRMRLWSESDIERLKEALPRNRQRQKAAVQKENSTQQSWQARDRSAKAKRKKKPKKRTPTTARAKS